mmetsp:Transcript_80622/g.224004  ORF Transcript_80622/g.224004 Transcript_80622/m.224004 type:complete len:208 (+) Transcript_80622:39-662(+)
MLRNYSASDAATGAGTYSHQIKSVAGLPASQPGQRIAVQGTAVNDGVRAANAAENVQLQRPLVCTCRARPEHRRPLHLPRALVSEPQGEGLRVHAPGVPQRGVGAGCQQLLCLRQSAHEYCGNQWRGTGTVVTHRAQVAPPAETVRQPHKPNDRGAHVPLREHVAGVDVGASMQEHFDDGQPRVERGGAVQRTEPVRGIPDRSARAE